jgi:hypothetical protein
VAFDEEYDGGYDEEDATCPDCGEDWGFCCCYDDEDQDDEDEE